MRTCVRVQGSVRVTSQGHPYARFQRALNGNSMVVIRAAASELERVSLEDGLAVCLAFLELEPETYPTAASRWVARLTLERRLAIVDSQLALAAVATLAGPSARAGAEALIELCARYRLSRVDMLLGAWLERRGLAD